MNLYLLLGVEKDASQEEIERAFTRISTQNYTLLGGMGMGGEQTARVEEAYAVLRDPRRRAEYDEKLAHGEA